MINYRPFAIVGIVMLLSATSHAFEVDIHYHVKAKIALADSWSWEEAYLIANADQAVDENKETTAELVINASDRELEQAQKNFEFHCFSRFVDLGNKDRNRDVLERLSELEQKANDAIDAARATRAPADTTRALIAIGVYLHCQEDSWSHLGYGFTRTGHTFDSAFDNWLVRSGGNLNNRTNPDHPAVRKEMTVQALRETRAKLSTFQQRWKGRDTDITDDDLQPLLDAITDPRTKLMLDNNRQECNNELAEHWLYLILERKNKLDKIPNQPQNIIDYKPSLTTYKRGPNCKTVHDTVFAGPHTEKTIRARAFQFPKLDLGAMPRRVNADGTYAEIGRRSFDLRVEKSVVQQHVGSPGECVYEVTVQAGNGGPDVSPRAMIVVGIAPTQQPLEPFGDSILLAPLQASQTTTQKIFVPGKCTSEYVVVTDIQPDPTFPLSIASWDDHSVFNDSFSQLLPPPTPTTCDVDKNGQVDRNDINAILAAGNTAAVSDDPRDADGNGVVTVEDARLCTELCTYPRCTP